MNRRPIPFLLAISLGLAQSAASASWTYRGTLEAEGRPAEGRYDLRFTLYDGAEGGRALAAPVVVQGVAVQRGELLARPDFGDALDRAGSAWLGVEVAAEGGAFEALPERQAVWTKAASAGVCWDTAGNAGNADGTNFLGNTDNIPLDLRVNNKRVARFTRPSGTTTNVVMGGIANSVDNGITEATIAGGGSDSDANVVHARGGTIGGGNGNDVGTAPDATFATVAGGIGNNASGSAATIAGGNSSVASGYSSTVGGGTFQLASGSYATVGGGFSNAAVGYASTVAGGDSNTAGGNYSFAGGQSAIVRGAPLTGTPEGDQGSFVWSDTSAGSFATTGINQFIVRANGGAAFNGKPNSNAVEFSIYGNNNGSSNVDLYMQPGGPTANFGYLFVVDGLTSADTNWTLYHSNANGSFTRRLQVTPTGLLGINHGNNAISTPIVVGTAGSGTNGNGANLTGGGTWTNGSSRTFKEGFAPIDTENVLDGVLALPIQTWSYKSSDEGRHLGPVAEDFKAAFGLGGDERYITTVDESGVALAAIQGLAHRLEAEQAANHALEARVAELEAKLARTQQ